MQKADFSIIVANYNNSEYLNDCIKSVIAQTAKNWEMIIYDDASSDNSVSVIKQYLADARIRLMRGSTNKGYICALKKMIDASRSNIIGILDGDDALVENAVEIMLKAHNENKNYGFIYSQFLYCDGNLAPLKIGRAKDIKDKSELLEDCVTAFKTFKKNIYLSKGGLNDKLRYAEDRDLYYKMEEITNFLFVDLPLYKYRYLPFSQSHDIKKKFIGDNNTAIAKHNAYKRRYNTGLPNFSRREISFLLLDFIILNLRKKNFKYFFVFLFRFLGIKTFRIKSILILIERIFARLYNRFLLVIIKYLHGFYKNKPVKIVIDIYVYSFDLLFRKRKKVLQNLDYLVIGSPRSGTGFMGKLLSSIGINTGHEKVYSVYKYDYLTFRVLNEKYRAESSFIAAPFVNKDYYEGRLKKEIKIIHIVRNPYQVISSLMSMCFFSDSKDKRHLLFLEFIYHYLPKIKKYDNQLDKTVYFWVNWNKLIERELESLPFVRRKIEDITAHPRVFFAEMGLEKAKLDNIFRDNKYNHKNDEKVKKINFLSSDLLAIKDDKLREDFLSLVNEYGYNQKYKFRENFNFDGEL